MTIKHETSDTLSKAAASLSALGPYYGDILLASERIFPHLKIIRRTKIEKNNSKIIAGGLDSNGEAVVHLGFGGDVPQPVRDRLVSRLGLPIEPHQENDGILQRIIFGHELGHVLQADDSFEDTFGPIDKTTRIPELGYYSYVNSDRELNADFIAAQLVGNSALGQILRISPPAQAPSQWREWAETRRIIA